MKITADRLAELLRSELGTDAIEFDPDSLAHHAIDGINPALICAPATPDQLAAALRICNETDAAVAPWGGGTAMHVGNAPRSYTIALATRNLNALIEHDHANLTATVQSGITLAALQTALAPQNQYAALDAPFPERATIGGIVAANLNGPRRGFHGSVRDLVIGIKVALPTGEQIKAGGKVVKNVAGYDMCKLFTGSLGTLGIITEVTLRMAALAEQSTMLSLRSSLGAALEFIQILAHSPLLPSAILLSRGFSSNTDIDDWQITILSEGFVESVERQITDLNKIAAESSIAGEVLNGAARDQRWQEIRDLPLRPDSCVFRLTLPRAALPAILEIIDRWNAGEITPEILADVASGVVWIVIPRGNFTDEQFAQLSALAREQHGHAIMFAPGEIKSGTDVWGPSPATLPLMREIKRQFDPQGIMNPGRFLGGL